MTGKAAVVSIPSPSTVLETSKDVYITVSPLGSLATETAEATTLCCKAPSRFSGKALFMDKRPGSITDVPGIRVGHSTDLEHATGCTVTLCPPGTVGGVDVRGSAPGTRETDLLRPGNLVDEVHAVLLSGGSAYGLDAASGVMRHLEENGTGYEVGRAVVPIVPGAVIFDLGLGSATVRPTADDGYAACQSAAAGEVAEGSVGAGTGATVGKALGMNCAVKGGLGICSLDMGDGLIVSAIAVVNALGDVVDPETGSVIAAPRTEDGGGFHSTVELMSRPRSEWPQAQAVAGGNTTIGVVATNASLSKEQANKLAERGQDGIAIAVRPSHTMGDGDTVFALATGGCQGRVDSMQLTRLGAVAASVMARAVVRGVTQAVGLAGVPGARELAR